MNREKEVDVDDIEIESNVVNSPSIDNIPYSNVKEKKYPSNFGEERKKVSLEVANNDEEKDQADLNVVEKFHVPQNLRKTFFCSLSLFIVGLTLIGIGFIREIAETVPGVGITFWTLGGIVLIPGGYYSYQFYKAKKSKSDDERNDILDQIPEL
jgi:hypothetical protein